MSKYVFLGIFNNHYEWEFPIDYNLLYDLESSDFFITEIYYEEYFFDILILQTHKNVLDYHYDLVIFKYISNTNIFYLYISIYVNLLYLFMDLINYFNSYFISIIFSLSYINNDIDILFKIIENINNYIL